MNTKRLPLRLCWLAALLCVAPSAGWAVLGEPGKQRETPPKDAVAEYCSGGILDEPVAFYQPEPPGGVLWELCDGAYLQRVAARLAVDAQGRIESVRWLSGSGCPAVDAELERCWSRWRYRPARCNGEAIDIRVFFYKQWSRSAPPAEPEEEYCPPFESVSEPPEAPEDDPSEGDRP